MDRDMKRRAFLTAAVGTLLGVPVAFQLMRSDTKGKAPHLFSRELKRLQSLTDVPVRTISVPSSTKLVLAPMADTNWNYVVFAPTFLPTEFSLALNGEPDVFLAREGTIQIRRNNSGQTVLTGGDSLFSVISPLQTDEKPKTGISLLADAQGVHLARPKNKTVSGLDMQFCHLLTLPGVPKELETGRKWKSNAGRLKPFGGYSTSYEIAGFAEVANRRTVQVRFEASIPNLAQHRDINADKDASMTNKHKGNAWFDLETGLLVRQELEMTTTCRGKELATRDKSNTMTIKSDCVVQLVCA